MGPGGARDYTNTFHDENPRDDNIGKFLSKKYQSYFRGLVSFYLLMYRMSSGARHRNMYPLPILELLTQTVLLIPSPQQTKTSAYAWS